MTAGAKPTSYSSTLTGLSKKIYDQWKADGIVKTESQIEVTIGSDTFTEKSANRATRVLSSKLDAYSIASSVIDDFTTNAEIKTNTGVVVETYVAGVGTNTGQLVAAAYPVVGSIKLPSLSPIAKIF